MLFYSVITAIKGYESKLELSYEHIKNIHSRSQSTIKFLVNIKKGSSKIYQVFNEHMNIPTGIIKWQNEHDVMTRWNDAFILLTKSTNDTKLLWLQFRILHHCLTTNRSVAKYKPEQSDLCEFCHRHSESIDHIFWLCPIILQFWTDLAEFINLKCTHVHNFKFTKDLVMFGICNKIKSDSILDLIILLTKQYIYACKVKRILPSSTALKRIIYNRYCIEKHFRDKSIDSRWIPYRNMFLSLNYSTL